MSTLLHINSSLFSDHGQSSQLAQRYVERWQAAHPDGTVVVRDLAAQPLPHLSAERFQAFLIPADQRSPEQQAHAAASDELIAELKTADVVVLGLPMYNFGIPSTLKAYFDHIARAGITFRYTANGPEGLIGDKTVLVFAARGGHYLGTPNDTQTPYIKTFFGFIGLKNVSFVNAEGLNLGPDAKEAALNAGHEAVDALAV